MNVNDRFEYMAAKFFTKTGIMAPGKDCALGCHSREHRLREWQEFTDNFYSELFDQAKRSDDAAAVRLQYSRNEISGYVCRKLLAEIEGK